MANEITKEDVVKFIEGMTVLELSELVKELEQKFGVSAAAPVAMVAAAGPAATTSRARLSRNNSIRGGARCPHRAPPLADFSFACHPPECCTTPVGGEGQRHSLPASLHQRLRLPHEVEEFRAVAAGVVLGAGAGGRGPGQTGVELHP